jgi:3-deoxy-7-phosphoheptulonate synthase
VGNRAGISLTFAVPTGMEDFGARSNYKTQKPLIWFKETAFLAVKVTGIFGCGGPSGVLIVMRAQATERDIAEVCARIQNLGFRAHVMPGVERTAVGITGNHGAVAVEQFESLAGVAEAIPVSKPYKLVSREVKPDNTIVDVAGVLVGGSELAICAGPCSVEGREQILEAARAVKAAGAQFLRGGAYKPRTSPYAFQGLGEEGLRYLAEAREETGLSIVTEVIDVETFDLVEQYADCLQVGSRNMQNFALLRRAGRARKPVLLKRGMASTLEEFLMAAEYVLSEGNYQVILCERGIRTFADHTRNTLDLSVVPAVQRLSHLPIIVDPSHGTGKRDKVHPMALAAVAAGASGLIVEVHPNPDRALSDGYQSLFPNQFRQLADDARAIAELLKNRKEAGEARLAPVLA